MYSKKWSVRIWNEFRILHPRVDEFIRSCWRIFWADSCLPTLEESAHWEVQIVRALTYMDTSQAFKNLWEDLKAQVKAFEKEQDTNAIVVFTSIYGKYLFRKWRQGTLTFE